MPLYNWTKEMPLYKQLCLCNLILLWASLHANQLRHEHAFHLTGDQHTHTSKQKKKTVFQWKFLV